MSDVDENAEEVTDEASAEPEPVETYYDVPVSWSGRQRTLHPSRDAYVDTIAAMKADGWVSVLDVCGVDYLTAQSPRRLPAGVSPERFEVVVSLINHVRRERARVRVQVPADDATLPSLFDLFPGTENMERETFDMFGVVFDGHPLMTRILLPEDWEGHPLRKDYDVGSVPVQFKLQGARGARPDASEVTS